MFHCSALQTCLANHERSSSTLTTCFSSRFHAEIRAHPPPARPHHLLQNGLIQYIHWTAMEWLGQTYRYPLCHTACTMVDTRYNTPLLRRDDALEETRRISSTSFPSLTKKKNMHRHNLQWANFSRSTLPKEKLTPNRGKYILRHTSSFWKGRNCATKIDVAIPAFANDNVKRSHQRLMMSVKKHKWTQGARVSNKVGRSFIGWPFRSRATNMKSSQLYATGVIDHVHTYY